MSQNELVAAVMPVVRLFEQLGISYYVGGSVASSAYGLPRTTLDADLVAVVRASQAAPICESLQKTYYASLPAIQSAVQRESSFNVIHLASMFKVDVFVCKRRPYDQTALTRLRPGTIGPQDDQLQVMLASPEDVVLSKLEWYRLDGEVSERQWLDVLGVLKVQHAAIDRPYLEQWASELGVADLLHRALTEAGIA